MNLLLKRHNARLIVSILYNDLHFLERSLRELERKFGPVDMETDEIEYLHTHAYVEEMGEGLRRKLFAFRRDVDPSKIAEVKEHTIRIEEKLGEKVVDVIFRKVNLDPLILSSTGLTLATSKDLPHRICVGNDIYAEKTLAMVDDHFESFPWTCPDFLEKEAIELFRQVARDLERFPAEFAPKLD